MLMCKNKTHNPIRKRLENKKNFMAGVEMKNTALDDIITNQMKLS